MAAAAAAAAAKRQLQPTGLPSSSIGRASAAECLRGLPRAHSSARGQSVLPRRQGAPTSGFLACRSSQTPADATPRLAGGRRFGPTDPHERRGTVLHWTLEHAAQTVLKPAERGAEGARVGPARSSPASKQNSASSAPLRRMLTGAKLEVGSDDCRGATSPVLPAAAARRAAHAAPLPAAAWSLQWPTASTPGSQLMACHDSASAQLPAWGRRYRASPCKALGGLARQGALAAGLRQRMGGGLVRSAATAHALFLGLTL